MANLDPLPPSTDKEFWEESEVITDIIPKKVKEEEKHYFVRVTGRSAKCVNCDWGFDLDPGDCIREGHLYSKDGTLVL